MIVCLSPEGLLGQLDDVGGGLDVNVVIVQGGWISGGAGLSQQNPQPATHRLRGGGLEEEKDSYRTSLHDIKGPKIAC